MKKKGENLRTLDDGELLKKLSGLEEKMRSLKFKAEGAKSKNVKESKSFRKEIARILTEMNSPARKNNMTSKKK